VLPWRLAANPTAVSPAQAPAPAVCLYLELPLLLPVCLQAAAALAQSSKQEKELSQAHDDLTIVRPLPPLLLPTAAGLACLLLGCPSLHTAACHVPPSSAVQLAPYLSTAPLLTICSWSGSSAACVASWTA
jgi:hypothetical protein